MLEVPTRLRTHLRRLGLPTTGLHIPDLREHSSTAAFGATHGQQVGTHLRLDGYSRLIPEAKSKVDHVRKALALPELPFDFPAPLSEDTLAAVDFVVARGPDIARTRSLITGTIRAKAKQLRKFNAKLVAIMTPDVRSIAGENNIALLLYLQVLTRWADVRLASRYIIGVPIVGPLENPAVFRPAPPIREYTNPSLLLQNSLEWVNELDNRRWAASDPRPKKALAESVAKDYRKGFASEPLTRSEVDRLFWQVNWRPLWRFVIFQSHNDKYRGIDDGAASGHNKACWTTKRVHTPDPTWVSAVAKEFGMAKQPLLRAAEQLGIPRSLQAPGHQLIKSEFSLVKCL